MKKLFVTIPDGDVKDTFIPDEVKTYMDRNFEVTYNSYGRNMTKAELRECLSDFDAVLTGWGTEKLDESVLGGNDRLKLIVHTGGTVGNLVDDYAYNRGIKVYSGNIMYATSVAEGTIAYMLMALRRIPEYLKVVKSGGWRTEGDMWEGLLDRSVGIAGLGTISRIVIRMLQCFNVKIKVFSHYEIEQEFLDKYNCVRASLEEIFATCDIVSVHSALNEENRNLIRKEHLELLKDGSLFINTSRGPVVNENDLITELNKNRFRAVLDVFDNEPLDNNHPFRTMENVYAIPHMAGPTLDRRKHITRALVDEAEAFFEGRTESEFEISENMAKRMTK